MSTNFHTPIATGAAANAATVNAPLGTLDAAINTLDNAKVSKVYESDGGGPAVQVTAGGNVMVGTSTDITGATLQVAGGVVVSDGAGAALQTLQSRELLQKSGSLYGSHQLITQPISNGATETIVSVPTGGTAYATRTTISGMAKRASDSAVEIFDITVAKTIGQTAIVSFSSIGNTRGSAFLASTDFTATDNGTTAINITYTNNETSSVTLYATIDYLGR